MARTKTCKGCTALVDCGNVHGCSLNYPVTTFVYTDIDSDNRHYIPAPIEKCPKPKTYKAFTKLIKNHLMNPHCLDHVKVTKRVQD